MGMRGVGALISFFFLTFEGLILLGTECSLGTKVFTLTREGADPMAPYPCGGGNDSWNKNLRPHSFLPLLDTFTLKNDFQVSSKYFWEQVRIWRGEGWGKELEFLYKNIYPSINPELWPENMFRCLLFILLHSIIQLLLLQLQTRLSWLMNEWKNEWMNEKRWKDEWIPTWTK